MLLGRISFKHQVKDILDNLTYTNRKKCDHTFFAYSGLGYLVGLCDQDSMETLVIGTHKR